MGLGQIFADDAEFPYMIDGVGNLTISKIAQKASFEINEEGGVASAATGKLFYVLTYVIDAIEICTSESK